MQKYTCLLLLLFASCGSMMPTQTAAKQDTLEEVRIALMDVHQACSSQKIELQNLEEKVAELKPNALIKTSSIDARIHQLEKQLANIQDDLHSLRSHANETAQTLQKYRSQIAAIDTLLKNQTTRLDEVGDLKTTLNSISKAIGSGSGSQPQIVQIHHVVSGDTLEKIARQYNISVDSLKRTNNLHSNTILIGQELKITE